MNSATARVAGRLDSTSSSAMASVVAHVICMGSLRAQGCLQISGWHNRPPFLPLLLRQPKACAAWRAWRRLRPMLSQCTVQLTRRQVEIRCIKLCCTKNVQGNGFGQIEIRIENWRSCTLSCWCGFQLEDFTHAMRTQRIEISQVCFSVSGAWLLSLRCCISGVLSSHLVRGVRPCCGL